MEQVAAAVGTETFRTLKGKQLVKKLVYELKKIKVMHLRISLPPAIMQKIYVGLYSGAQKSFHNINTSSSAEQPFVCSECGGI